MVTESPTTMRTIFLRIFPEMVANTICFVGSISTRNMAFGSDSVTLPVTWITSSLVGFRGPGRSSSGPRRSPGPVFFGGCACSVVTTRY